MKAAETRMHRTGPTPSRAHDRVPPSGMRPGRRRFHAMRRAGALGVLLLATALAACSDKKKAAGQPPPAPPPAVVSTLAVEPRTATLERIYPARVRAVNDVE